MLAQSVLVIRLVLCLILDMSWQVPLQVPQGQLSGKQLSNEETLSVMRSAITQIQNQLTTSTTKAASYSNRELSYLTAHLVYQVQPPQSFTDQVEDCYTAQGYLVHNPTMLVPIKENLPQRLMLATFDTSLLLAKTTAQVIEEIRKARTFCSFWEQADDSYDITDNPNCEAQLTKSICAIPTAVSQEMTRGHNYVQQLFPRMVGSIQDSLQEISQNLMVSPKYINDIGYTIRIAADLASKILGLVQTYPLNHTVISETWMLTEYTQQVSDLLMKSHMEQMRQQHRHQQRSNELSRMKSNINTLTTGLQTLTNSQTAQGNAHQATLLRIEQQLEELRQEQLKQQQLINNAKLQQLEKKLEKIKNEEGSSLTEDEADSDNSSQSPSLPTLIEDLRTQVQSLEANNCTGTVVLWPTSIQIAVSEFLTYSIYNFYAAVGWGWLMVMIFLYTCYQAAKRDHRIQTLELELIQLRQQLMQQIQKRRSASNTNNPSAPLLRANVPSKRKILSAINKAASATT